MPAFSTAVTCFLCNAQVHSPSSLQCHDISAPKVPYKSEDKSKLMAHLKTEHGASQGMDYLMAGCTMSKEERIAIQVKVQHQPEAKLDFQMDLTCIAERGGRETAEVNPSRTRGK